MAWVLLAAYVCGSIPFGLLIVRTVAGVDLRTIGSGNIGATNASRVVGKAWGIFVLLLDALKGAVPTLCAPWLMALVSQTGNAATAQVLAGTAAIVGHMFPVWLKFRGGKGVATAFGVILILAPIPTLAAGVIFAILFAWKRIVSLGSMMAALTFGGVQLWMLRPNPFGSEQISLALFAIAVPVLILLRHRANIARLLRGEEPALQSARPPADQHETHPSGVPSDQAQRAEE